MSLDTPYIDYTAFSAHCQPSFSNNLQRIDHLLKLFPFDLEPVAVHNEPARVRVHKIQHLLIIMQRPPFKRTVLIKGGRSLLPPSPTTRLPGTSFGLSAWKKCEKFFCRSLCMLLSFRLLGPDRNEGAGSGTGETKKTPGQHKAVRAQKARYSVKF